jgi:hypothetical protein
MFRLNGEPFGGRVDDVARRHVRECDCCEAPFADGPALATEQPVAGVNDDGETGFSEQEVH